MNRYEKHCAEKGEQPPANRAGMVCMLSEAYPGERVFREQWAIPYLVTETPPLFARATGVGLRQPNENGATTWDLGCVLVTILPEYV